MPILPLLLALLAGSAGLLHAHRNPSEPPATAGAPAGPTEPFELSALDWSPDGGRLAFVAARPDPAGDTDSGVWVVDAAGAAPARPVSVAPGTERAPRFSPGGRWLALLARRDDDAAPQLYLVPPEGGGPIRMTAAPGGVDTYSWSPDGSAIVYTVFGAGAAGAHLWRLDVETGEGRRLTEGEFHVSGLDVSPDGLWIVHGRSPGAGAGSRDAVDLWMIPASGGEARRLTTGAGADTDPRWSPDGRRIAFRAAPP